MSIESLVQTYVVCDESGDFIEHACKECADEFAATNGLEWNWNHNFTEDHPSGLHAYNTLWDSGESDSPTAFLKCDQYLDVGLTTEGADYMKERGDFPAWLYAAYGIEFTP